MLATLTNILKSYSDIDFKITEEKVNRVESYYVKKQSEMNRFVDVVHTYLTIYKVFTEDDKKYRGSALTEIHPTMLEAEIRAAIDEAIYSAGFVKNEYYPLVEKTENAAQEIENDVTGSSLLSIAEKLKNSVHAQDNYEKGYLSFSEFFVANKNVRIVNSLGVDRSFECMDVYIETAVTWKEDKEIEIYESYSMSNCNTKNLSDRIKKLFTVASEKPLAKMTPVVKDINVILSGECLKEFFSYYFYNSNASHIYSKESVFQVGDNLQGENVLGDVLSIVLDPFLPGSKNSRPYDSDGFLLKKVELIEKGRLLRYWGDIRFSSYLGIETTGTIGNFIVTGGTHTIDEMKKEAYLELISFSDFQMDPTTGDFASEIRLGFYYDGNTLIPVTGGSVSGNIKNVHGDMKMSLETSTYDNYCGPTAISVRNVAIASC